MKYLLIAIAGLIVFDLLAGGTEVNTENIVSVHSYPFADPPFDVVFTDRRSYRLPHRGADGMKAGGGLEVELWRGGLGVVHSSKIKGPK